MDAQELLDEWTGNEPPDDEDEEVDETDWEYRSGLPPQRVKTLRDDLRRHTGLPVPRRVHEVESWVERMKGTVTQKLQEAIESESADE